MSFYSSLKRTVLRLGTATVAATLTLTAVASDASAAGYSGPWFVADMPYATTTQWVPGSTITVGELADPDVFQENGTYYAYGTSNGGRNVPLITSTDLKNWKTNKKYTPVKSARMDNGSTYTVQNANDPWYNDTLAVPGSWVQRQPANSGCNANSSGCYEIWAPSVEKAANGKYVMAYVGISRYNANGSIAQQCIGLATSDKPTGPFVDTSSKPVQCGSDPTGALDPDLYKDPNGKLYLYWKNEGNAATNARTNIWVQEVSNDGKTLRTAPSKMGLETQAVKTNTAATNWKWFETWEKPLIENPSMVRYQGSYYMFYSASEYSTSSYRTGYAKCSGPTGPCERVQNTPLMTTDFSQGLIGPGGASAFVDKTGALRLGYAAWLSAEANGRANYTCPRTAAFFPADKRQTACIGNQRFFHVASVSKDKNGLFSVSKKSEFVSSLGAATQTVAFRDVASNNQFYTEISWLANTGITTGWGSGANREYRPLQSIERGAMAAFMYRLAGSPDFTAPSNPSFRDVPRGHQFYKEIEWMKAVGITTGYSDGTFRPDASINRDAMAAFMYRMAGQPAYTASPNAFSDTRGIQFAKEMAWVKDKGISTGYGDGTYRPWNTVNRDAMAAFMYRLTQTGPLIGHP